MIVMMLLGLSRQQICSRTSYEYNLQTKQKLPKVKVVLFFWGGGQTGNTNFQATDLATDFIRPKTTGVKNAKPPEIFPTLFGS